MSMSVKPGYVNPLTMMGQKKNGLTKTIHPKQESDKSNEVEDLLVKKQSLQNQMLILKSTSDGASMSSETQEFLEKEIEDIASELRTAKSMEIRDIPDVQKVKTESKANFDHYEKTSETEKAPGMYQLLKDKEKGYQVAFSPYEK